MSGSVQALIKICGLMRAEDVEAVNAAQPDFCGFILTEGFRRSVAPEFAAQSVRRLEGGIVPVGVFVDEAPERVAAVVRVCSLGAIQLHGDEDDAYIERLRDMVAATGRLLATPIIKAFSVRTRADVNRACASAADHILLDNGKGTGVEFDWGLLRGIRRPFFLAGGLGPDNVAEAIERVHPLGVDMSSGVETDGLKDSKKILAAIAAARGVRQEDLS